MVRALLLSPGGRFILTTPCRVVVSMYGLASATVGPFAFGARPIDMPIAFFLGSILGTLQLVVAPKSNLYVSVPYSLRSTIV